MNIPGYFSNGAFGKTLLGQDFKRDSDRVYDKDTRHINVDIHNGEPEIVTPSTPLSPLKRDEVLAYIDRELAAGYKLNISVIRSDTDDHDISMDGIEILPSAPGFYLQGRTIYGQYIYEDDNDEAGFFFGVENNPELRDGYWMDRFFADDAVDLYTWAMILRYRGINPSMIRGELIKRYNISIADTDRMRVFLFVLGNAFTFNVLKTNDPVVEAIYNLRGIVDDTRQVDTYVLEDIISYLSDRVHYAITRFGA